MASDDFGSFTGAEFLKLAKKFGALPDKILENAKETVLPKAGAIMEEYQLGVIQTEGLVDTEQMRDSVKITVYEDRVNVGPSGRRAGNGRTNALSAVMLDRRNPQHTKKGTNWVRRANEAAEDAIFTLAENEFGRILDDLFIDDVFRP